MKTAPDLRIHGTMAPENAVVPASLERPGTRPNPQGGSDVIERIPESRVRLYWSNVDKSAGPDGCWLWVGGGSIYGQFGVRFNDGERHKYVGAHRVSVALDGRDPTGFVVCHSCDTPRCVNPAHLFLGTSGDNFRDMVAKRRSTMPAKLTEDEAVEIRRRVAEGETLVSVARSFGVDASWVSRVVRGEAHRDAGGPLTQPISKTHCPHGHEYTPENTYRSAGKPARRCRACKLQDNRIRNERVRLGMAPRRTEK